MRKCSNFFLIIYKYIRIDLLRHEKYKNKQLKNKALELEIFKPIKISINDMDKFEKKRANKEENIYKKHMV